MNVHTVSSPDWIVRLSTPVGAGVPVGCPSPTLLVRHECVLEQPVRGHGLVQVDVPGVYGISICDPLPLTVNFAPLSGPPDALKTNAVPSFGVATFTIVRNPEPAATTHSEGDEPRPDG